MSAPLRTSRRAILPSIVTQEEKPAAMAATSDLSRAQENPLRAGMRLEPTAPPCAVLIFGATGDLTKRKLIPALYRLAQQGLVSGAFAILGAARKEMSDDEFRLLMQKAVEEFASDESLDESTWQSFAKRIFYLAGDFNDAELYQKLKGKLQEIDSEYDTQGNRIFYLATAPDYFGVIARQLGDAKMAHSKDEAKDQAKDEAKDQAQGKAWTRIIIEKPFGHDLESARALNQELATVFDEKQVYRIDHYLGKETVQNLLVFRLQTASSNHCGTGSTSITFRLPMLRHWALKVEAVTMKRPEPCET